MCTATPIFSFSVLHLPNIKILDGFIRVELTTRKVRIQLSRKQYSKYESLVFHDSRITIHIKSSPFVRTYAPSKEFDIASPNRFNVYSNRFEITRLDGTPYVFPAVNPHSLTPALSDAIGLIELDCNNWGTVNHFIRSNRAMIELTHNHILILHSDRVDRYFLNAPIEWYEFEPHFKNSPEYFATGSFIKDQQIEYARLVL
jgi:hypothetical protein